MAGAIKIQHGTTPTTPQAGFSTLYVSSVDGEFYYKKPDGTVESLVGPQGATGVAGPQGATGIGLGLISKNIKIIGSQMTYDGGSGNSYYDWTFSSAFTSTDYSLNCQYYGGFLTGNAWADLSYFQNLRFTNKTTTGVRFILESVDVPSTDPTAEFFIQAIALGETSVSYYGNFLSTVSQPNAGATAANMVTYNTTDFASGVSIVSNSRITIANAGIYNIEFSAQFQKTSGGDDYVDIWLSKNGNNVANSTTTVHLVSNPGYGVAAWNFLVDANAGDYYELIWHSSDTTMELHAAAAGTNPTRPAIPSVILSVSQISS